MIAIWVWAGVSIGISVIALIALFIAFLEDDTVDGLIPVVSARVALLSCLWPLAVVWLIVLLAFNRNPLRPTKKMWVKQ